MDPLKINHEHVLINVKKEVDEGDTLNFCQTCLTISQTSDLRDMTKEYSYNTNSEIYLKMLEYCFSLKMGDESNVTSESVYMICSSCIYKLQNAVNFKKLVFSAQETIKEILESNVDSTLNEELEDLYNDDIKQHFPSDEDMIESPPIKLETLQIEVPKLQEKTYKMSSLIELIRSNPVPKDRKNLNLHRKTPYTVEESERECKICNKVFPTNKGLKMHMPEHFPNFTCEHCGRGFATKHQLSTHRVVHSTDKFECPRCPGKWFKSRPYLTVHIRTRHEGLRRHICPCCGERFTEYNQRMRHLVEVHGQKELLHMYPCSMCDRKFKTTGIRSTHYRSFHMMERNHTCRVCSSSFYSSSMLGTHMLKHTQVKAFECDTCQRKFSRKVHLKVHMKRHTKVQIKAA